MTEVGKNVMGKTKIVLVVSIVVLVVSVISNVWFYTQTTSLQIRVSSSESEYNDYVATHSHSNSEYQKLSINYTQLEESY